MYKSPPNRVETNMDLSSRIPVRKDTHMKISSYMRKRIKFKGHRQSVIKDREESKLDSPDSRNLENQRIEPSRYMSASFVANDD